ncbi:MAG: substrate-binding domain-containing protein [Chitinophagales bacterium]|nr:substrate-binding domain-containing protein [Chitinophagales bacterium]
MKYLFAALFASFLFSCGPEKDKKGRELSTPTTGYVKISVDETYYPIVEAELDIFHSFYKYAIVEPQYVPEGAAIKALMDDSTDVALLARELTDKEKEYFNQKKIFPKITHIAKDALALIVHPSISDSIISVDQLKALFNGDKSAWPGFKTDQNNIQIVFDNTASSTARYMQENFSQKLPEYCFAVKTNPEVITYVASHPNAIGVIGVNWISDSDDSMAVDFLDKVNVLRVRSDKTDERGLQPYQAYIAQETYPLIRNMYIVSIEGRNGLGTGFAAFAASDKGQRIILKSGLVPATMPVRIIGFE